MSERRRSRMRWALAGGLTWLGLFGVAFGLWYADEVGAFRNCYLKIRTPSGPAGWVQFKGNRLRTASSTDALGRAQWVRAKTASWERTEFPAITLSTSEQGPDRGLRAQFTLFGTQSEINWEVTRHDLDGTRWTYLVKSMAPVASRPEACAEISAPNAQQLALAIETQPERDGEDLELGVGLHVSGSPQREVQVSDIRKEGRGVRARIQIKNDAGKVVLTEEKPLSDLGFT